jgi:predicted MFS family arabinose efflux permease
MGVDTILVGTVGAAFIMGTALGTSLLAAVMVRRGKRVGLALGYAIAVIGGLVGAWSVVADAFPALLLGSLLIGFANSSSQLSRYASAEMASPARRAAAISIVVWAATVGAILGPVSVPISATLAAGVGMPELAGPFLLPAIFAILAAALLARFLRPDPDELAVDPDAGLLPAQRADRHRDAVPMSRILRRPPVAIALTAMIVGQVVMIVIMAMTPLHMTDHGHGLDAIGVVISAHVLGMFALSPLTGRIADRIGSLNTILLGSSVLAVAALMAATAPPDGGTMLLVALFLLGYGWNLGFVSGSALLTSGLRPEERTTTQGFTDSLVWGSSALASLAGGIVLALTGFAALGLIGAVLLVLPVWAVLSMRGRISAFAEAG